MNVATAPRSKERKTDRYDSRLKIKTYDNDNLYPQNILSIVRASAIGSTCLDRFIDFIEGNGIRSSELSDYVVNSKHQTMDDIHHLCCVDIGSFGGFALHVNYDIFCRPCEIQSIPFEACRLEEPDDDGRVNHVMVHPDWRGQSTRNGKKLYVNAETVDIIDVWNPEPEVVRAQMERAGGIEHYNGQVFYYSTAGYMTYPRPRYDSAITDISTDEGLSNIMNRNARNNFLPAGILVYFKNRQNNVEYDSEGKPIPAPETEDPIIEQVASIQGDNKACKIMAFGIDYKEEMPEFKSFDAHNYDKDFNVSMETVEDRIYGIFGQEGWLSVKRGKVGFSGNLVNDIKREYCEFVTKYQRPLTNAYMRILNLFDPTTLPAPVTVENLTIEPIIASLNTTTNGTDNPDRNE